MEVVRYPHPALCWKSKPVTEISGELRTVVRAMFDLMYESRGIGLAANQVGLPYRFFIVNVTADPEEVEEEFVFINPEITQRKGSVEGEEGCLSIPEMYGQVRRAEEIVVDAFDLAGRGFEMALEGLPARVVQHECDHLDGVLFVDRLSETARREIVPQLSDFETLFRRKQQSGQCASDGVIRQQLHEYERTGKMPASSSVTPASRVSGD